ncbi:hypothetical protein [Prauserella cavernicola]|uniref:hypothetical protein n=1 Tax=Prauserella cavernicola TaxID=2800127 RepID=UPI0027DD7DF8|nr:hypothetical protein [Prauserella cavernicola]
MSGRLSDRVEEVLRELGGTEPDDVRVEPTPPETVIYGRAGDATELTELLELLQNLGLHIVSVQRVPGPRPGEAPR